MKRTLFILAAVAWATMASQASTVLVSFGNKGGGNNTTAVVNGTYLRNPGQTVNKVTGSDNSYLSSALQTTDGITTNITVRTGGAACGSAGALTVDNSLPSTAQGDNKFFDVFGQDMATGTPMGGAINGSNGGSFTTSLLHLSTGTYTLTILAGRGNNYGTNSSTFSIGGSNITNISASLDNTSDAGASLLDNTITANTNNGNWTLMTYTFEVTADDAQLNINTTGGGNINALALTAVPEPAAASLGLLGLAALMARRRRA